MFHPRGVLCRAEVRPATDDPLALRVAERLSGPALLRWSSAWWKGREWPDVLGCAIRFTSDPLVTSPRDSDQDLLFATIRRPWTMGFAPLSTRFHDFLANDYFAVSPFLVAELGRVEWSLRPEEPSPAGGDRNARLLGAIAAGATLVLEYSPYRPPARFWDRSSFRPLVTVTLVELCSLDQEALRFDPFLAGRGIVPVGFVHALRKATYAASQRLRPSSSSRRRSVAARPTSELTGSSALTG
jgi:hypothetical protein